MNKPVSFKLANLLQEKGFNEKCNNIYAYGNESYPFENLAELDNTNDRGYYLAPTIAKVVMWLYEKHGIWIEAPFWDSKFRFKIINTVEEIVLKGIDFEGFNSPTEAYEKAIEYVLKNLI